MEHADTILVLDHGQIIANGNHETLMQTSEIYREIYEAQTKGKNADADVNEAKEGGEA